MALFSLTSSIKEAAQLVNQVPPNKLSKILQRILQKLHLKNDAPFSEEELEKLSPTLGLSNEQLVNVLAVITFFYQQAAYHSAKPKVFGEQLLVTGVDSERATVFQDIWTSEARSVIEELRKRSIAPNQLETINWQLNLELAQNSKTKQKTPSAVFELGVSNSSSQELDRMHIEFNHHELYQFFDQLETVQTQLDSLS